MPRILSAFVLMALSYSLVSCGGADGYVDVAERCLATRDGLEVAYDESPFAGQVEGVVNGSLDLHARDLWSEVVKRPTLRDSEATSSDNVASRSPNTVLQVGSVACGGAKYFAAIEVVDSRSFPTCRARFCALIRFGKPHL